MTTSLILNKIADALNSLGAKSVVINLGAALAAAISWSAYHSILWATVHGLLGWLYVIYFALTRQGG